MHTASFGQRKDDVRGVLYASKSFRLMKVHSRRGKAHILYACFGVDMIDDDVTKKREILEMKDENSESRWSSSMCYVIRFVLCRDEILDFYILITSNYDFCH